MEIRSKLHGQIVRIIELLSRNNGKERRGKRKEEERRRRIIDFLMFLSSLSPVDKIIC